MSDPNCYECDHFPICRVRRAWWDVFSDPILKAADADDLSDAGKLVAKLCSSFKRQKSP